MKFRGLVDLQLKAFDYAILEKYQSYLHKTMRKMDFQVIRTWSTPYQELELEALIDKSAAIDSSTKIKIYERNIQVKDPQLHRLPLLIDIVHLTSPSGVSFNVIKHTAQEEDRIHFRDSVLESLKEELQELKDTPLIGV